MRKQVLKNIFFNFLIRACTWLFSFLAAIFAARVLQPAAYGRVSFASSIAGYFIRLAAFGLPIYGMRTIAESGDDRSIRSKSFNELWSITALTSAVSMVILLLLILFVPRFRDNKVLILISASGIIFQLFGCPWLFRGLEKFHFLAVFTFICKSISLVCMILFLHSEAQTVLYAVFSVFAAYGCDLFCLFILSRFVDEPFRFRFGMKHFPHLVIFFLMSCAVFVYNGLDQTMLGFIRTEYETGLYSLAAKCKGVLTVTGGLVCTSILPQAVRLRQKGDIKGFDSLAEKTMVSVCGIQFFLMVFCMIFAEKIIMLTGGQAYQGSIKTLRILLFSLVPIGASNILGEQVLIPAGRESRLLCAEVLGALFSVSANLILIPRFSINGAALTAVLSEVIVWLVCLYYAKKDLGTDFGFDLLRKVMRFIHRIG